MEPRVSLNCTLLATLELSSRSWVECSRDGLDAGLVPPAPHQPRPARSSEAPMADAAAQPSAHPPSLAPSTNHGVSAHPHATRSSAKVVKLESSWVKRNSRSSLTIPSHRVSLPCVHRTTRAPSNQNLSLLGMLPSEYNTARHSHVSSSTLNIRLVVAVTPCCARPIVARIS